MAEDSRPPPGEPAGLPRRTPGAGGLTPGQVRRGFLRPLDEPQTEPTGQAADDAPAVAAPESAPSAEPPSPATLAASASRLVRATSAAEIAAAAAAELAAAAAPRRPGPEAAQASVQSSVVTALAPAGPAAAAAEAPASLDALELAIGPPAAATRLGDERARLRGRRPQAAARRWQLAGLVIAVVIMTGTVLAIVASHRPPKPHAGAVVAPPGSQRLANASATRNQAIGWVAAQVGRDVSVACDPATCSALAARGFPASNLTVLQPTAPDPYGSVLVIATADIRSQFGTKLETVYAPQVIASFGTGPTRIDIRAVAPLGPAAYAAALSADLAARKSSGAQLLRNPRITVGAGARTLLADGLIDSRLLATVAFLAVQNPINIIGFGGASPGAAPVPLRSVYLAESDAAAHIGSGYVQALESALQRQNPPYVPLSVASVQLGGGPPVLQVEFAAPSPLGLLHS